MRIHGTCPGNQKRGVTTRALGGHVLQGNQQSKTWLGPWKHRHLLGPPSKPCAAVSSFRSLHLCQITIPRMPPQDRAASGCQPNMRARVLTFGEKWHSSCPYAIKQGAAIIETMGRTLFHPPNSPGKGKESMKAWRGGGKAKSRSTPFWKVRSSSSILARLRSWGKKLRLARSNKDPYAGKVVSSALAIWQTVI